MTTKVTIDAHAGWPVEITVRRGEPDRPKEAEVFVIEPGAKADFHIHSGLEILSVRELKRSSA